MVYGSKVYRVSNFVQLRTPMDIRRLVMKMPKVANGARRTGAALQAMVRIIETDVLIATISLKRIF